MHFSLTLRQLKRSPLRTALYGLVMLLLTAFFCVSLNLYFNSRKNLQMADEAFTTIAVTELYADVDQYGNVLPVLDLEAFEGHLPTRVKGYDLSPILSGPGVLKYDLRARYAAYIPSERALVLETGSKTLKTIAFTEDVIRFTVIGDEPVELPLNYTGNVSITTENIRVLDSACGMTFSDELSINTWLVEEFEARHREEAGIGDADCYTFEPGVEYIATVGYVEGQRQTAVPDDGDVRISYFCLYCGGYSFPRSIMYFANSGEFSGGNGYPEYFPFWVYKYEDVQADDRLRKYFQAVAKACEISYHSFAVMTANDALGIPLFHFGNAYLMDGRMITQEEYDTGAKVCLISAQQAKIQRWNVGDKLNMSFYEDNFMVNRIRYGRGMLPEYTKYADDFFDGGEYEIVGIYGVRELTGESSVSQNAIELPWNMLILPEASVQNGMPEAERPISGATLTIWLQNGRANDFLSHMEALGITEPKAGEYDAKFTFYDQGYSKIMPSLQTLDGTARLLLILSGSLLGIAAVLLGFFYVAGQRKNIGVMRLLGCPRAATFGGSMWGALLCAGAGSLGGAVLGLLLTEGVSGYILSSTIENVGRFTAFSAFLAAGQQAEIAFATHADVRLGLLALAAGLGLFLISAAAFMVHSVARPPRALLAQDQK